MGVLLGTGLGVCVGVSVGVDVGVSVGVNVSVAVGVSVGMKFPISGTDSNRQPLRVSSAIKNVIVYSRFTDITSASIRLYDGTGNIPEGLLRMNALQDKIFSEQGG